MARTPARRLRAPARRSCGGLRRLRDPALGARRGRAAGRGRRPRVHGGCESAHRRDDRTVRNRRRRPVRDGAAPRAPAHRDDVPDARTGRPARGRRAALGRGRRGRLDRGPRGQRPDRRRRGRLRLRQRAPASRAAAPHLPDRAPARHERDLDALQRGWRLRTARVVVGRGLGLEGGVRHRPPSNRGGGWSGGARLPRELVRGRRLRPRARSAAPDRAGVGAGGDLGAEADRDRLGLGVDRLQLPPLSRVQGIPLPGVLRGLLRRALQGAARRLVGHLPRVATPTFRNWDLPERRQIFAGLRLATDGAG